MQAKELVTTTTKRIQGPLSGSRHIPDGCKGKIRIGLFPPCTVPIRATGKPVIESRPLVVGSDNTMSDALVRKNIHLKLP